MISLQHDHPIFSRYKTHKVDLELVVCFPPGAGGNFICLTYEQSRRGRVQDERSTAVRSLNEFAYGTGTQFLWLDESMMVEDQSGLISIRHDLDALEMQLMQWKFPDWTELSDGGRFIGVTHTPPVVTAAICDLKVDHMLFVESNQQHAWIPRALHVIKNRLVPLSEKPDLVAMLLSEVDFCGTVTHRDYMTMLQALANATKCMPIDHTLISWKYLLYCYKTQRDFCSADVFRAYMTNAVFGNQHDLQSNESFCPCSTSKYKKMRDWIVERYPKHSIISYFDLFFRGGFSVDHPLYDHVPWNDVRKYTKGNLDLFNQLLPLFTQEISDKLAREVERLHELI